MGAAAALGTGWRLPAPADAPLCHATILWLTPLNLAASNITCVIIEKRSKLSKSRPDAANNETHWGSECAGREGAMRRVCCGAGGRRCAGEAGARMRKEGVDGGLLRGRVTGG